MTDARPDLMSRLIEVGGTAGADDATVGLDDLQEQVWVDVIHKMDEVYSDLLRYEVGLEEKNARLEEAQAFIGSVLSSMSDVLIVCGMDGRVQEVNRPVLDMTGFSAGQVDGMALADLLMAEGKDNPLATFLRRPSDAVLRECEVRLHIRGGGTTDIIAMNCSRRADHRGRPEGTVLIGRPVGELRRAYAQLEQAHDDLKQAQQQLVQQEKMASLGRLVAGVAHELNNPISFVNGNVHVLDKYVARLRRYISAIHDGTTTAEREALRKDLRIDALLDDAPDLIAGTLEGAGRVTEIVRSLRRLSFAQPGPAEALDLSEIAGTAVQWTVKGARRPPLVRLDLPAGLLVDGHAGHLHQVVTNLVQNALDAQDDQPDARLDVCAQRDGGMICLTVRDGGPGIPEETLGAVFDPFFTTKPVGQGTGLGLWISYGLVRDHGGSLSVANHPDGGAVFLVEIPSRE